MGPPLHLGPGLLPQGAPSLRAGSHLRGAGPGHPRLPQEPLCSIRAKIGQILAMPVQLHTRPLLTLLFKLKCSTCWPPYQGKCHRKLGVPTLRSPQQALGPVPHRQGDPGRTGGFMRKTTAVGLVWLVVSVSRPQRVGLGKPGLAGVSRSLVG